MRKPSRAASFTSDTVTSFWKSTNALPFEPLTYQSGLAADVAGPILTVSLRAVRSDLPVDIAALRRPPYESRADAVMYRHVLCAVAEARGWRVHLYDPEQVVGLAVARLGTDAGRVLDGPRARLGPPWTKDHRTAVAATVVAARG